MTALRFIAASSLCLAFCQSAIGAEAELIHDLSAIAPATPNCGDFRDVNGVTLAILDTTQNGCELWALSGPGAPKMLTETYPGAGHQRPFFVGSATNGWHLLYALSKDHGMEFWRTDGATYELVDDFSPGTPSTQPSRISYVPQLGRTYISAAVYPEPNKVNYRLLSFDGENLVDALGQAGEDFSFIESGPMRLGDKVIFLGRDEAHGLEPRIFDGQTVELVADSVAGEKGIAATGIFAAPFGQGIVFDGTEVNGGVTRREFYRMNEQGVTKLQKLGASYPGDLNGFYETGIAYDGRDLFIGFRRPQNNPGGTPIHWMDDTRWKAYMLPNSADAQDYPFVFTWHSRHYAVVDGEFYRLGTESAEKVASPFGGLPTGRILTLLAPGVADRVMHWEVQAADGRRELWQSGSTGFQPVADAAGKPLVDVRAIRPVGEDHYVLARTRDRGWAIWRLAATQPGTFADLAAVSGSWYDPATSGQGFAIQTVNDDTSVFYFYGYRDDGSPLWLIGVGSEPIVEGQAYTVTMNVTSGGGFGGFDPEDISEAEWGTLEITFDDCEQAHATLSGADGEQQFDLVRLAGIDGLGCQLFQLPLSEHAGISGSWYEPATAGQGLFLQVFGEDTIIAYFYGYENAEKRLWLIGVHEGPIAMDQWIDIGLNVTSGGTFDDFDPGAIEETPWGTLSIRFGGCGTAVATMSGLHGEQSLDLVKLAKISPTEANCD